jgi:heme iron utilization protein
MNEELTRLIKNHLDSQLFGVLATQSQEQPYTNLIAFAEAGHLRNIIFVTARNTRKYNNALNSKSVALLIDNRTNQASDLHSALAITALGSIDEVIGGEKDRLSEIYLSKHPGLKNFLKNPLNALMRVTVKDYIIATFEGIRRLSIS